MSKVQNIRQGRLYHVSSVITVELLMRRAGYLAPTATTLRTPGYYGY